MFYKAISLQTVRQLPTNSPSTPYKQSLKSLQTVHKLPTTLKLVAVDEQPTR